MSAIPDDPDRPLDVPETDSPRFEVDELTPDGGLVDPTPAESMAEASSSSSFEEDDADADTDSADAKTTEIPSKDQSESAHEGVEQTSDDLDDETIDAVAMDDPADDEASTDLEGEPDEDAPQLSWYMLKVQSNRENTIRDALHRRIKIENLGQYFGQIMVPTEKIAEIRNNKKRIVERKMFPGYIAVEMELNERTWYLIRETSGVGDFVGAHGKPMPLSPDDIAKMTGAVAKSQDESTKGPEVEIPYERGDRVKIKDGPFENFEGTVEDVDKTRGTVKVMCVIFNRNTPVDLEYWQVEKI